MTDTNLTQTQIEEDEKTRLKAHHAELEEFWKKCEEDEEDEEDEEEDNDSSEDCNHCQAEVDASNVVYYRNGCELIVLCSHCSYLLKDNDEEQCEQCNGDNPTVWLKADDMIVSVHTECQEAFVATKKSVSLTF